ncbi:hypothetical protein DFH09DRAFT_1502259 [Mycena vulgaris]|nr:hypothetical protein DFH09DRAFT_1502259 [Mycena vulgaris]
MPHYRPPPLSLSTSDDDTDVPNQVMTLSSPPPWPSKTPRKKAPEQTPPKPSLSHTRSARMPLPQSGEFSALPPPASLRGGSHPAGTPHVTHYVAVAPGLARLWRYPVSLARAPSFLFIGPRSDSTVLKGQLTCTGANLGGRALLWPAVGFLYGVNAHSFPPCTPVIPAAVASAPVNTDRFLTRAPALPALLRLIPVFMPRNRDPPTCRTLPLYSPSVIPWLRILAFDSLDIGVGILGLRSTRIGQTLPTRTMRLPLPPAPPALFLFSILAPRPGIYSRLCPLFLCFSVPLCLCFSPLPRRLVLALASRARASPRGVCVRVPCATRMPSAFSLCAGTPAPPDSKTSVRRSAALARVPKPGFFPRSFPFDRFTLLLCCPGRSRMFQCQCAEDGLWLAALVVSCPCSPHHLVSAFERVRMLFSPSSTQSSAQLLSAYKYSGSQKMRARRRQNYIGVG